MLEEIVCQTAEVNQPRVNLEIVGLGLRVDLRPAQAGSRETVAKEAVDLLHKVAELATEEYLIASLLLK